jgi:LacI family transcriptional regulator
MTIKDIAKECGCAIGTVSRVLNNHPDVSDKTREKVLSVVNKHNFVLNVNAKQLKAQGRKNIVVIVKGTQSPLLASLLEGIQHKLEPLTYTVEVVVLDENDNEAVNAVRIYFEQKPIGFVFLGGSPDKYPADMEKIKVPCVLISNAAEDISFSNLSSVATDNTEASFFATQHLLNNGHTNIGIIGGNIDTSFVTKSRYEGFINAITQAKINFEYEKSYVFSKYSFQGGFEAAEELIKKNPDITAIYAMSDVMAIGACRKLTDMGIKVPEQISIIGFDGIELSSYTSPRLTTILQLKDELVEQGI